MKDFAGSIQRKAKALTGETFAIWKEYSLFQLYESKCIGRFLGAVTLRGRIIYYFNCSRVLML